MMCFRVRRIDLRSGKMKKSKAKCRYCMKDDKHEEIKYYIIADNLEEPKAYHPSCMEKFKLECFIELSK